MKRETIENILNFLKEKEGQDLPEEWFDSVKKYKLIQKLENHPDGTQYKHESGGLRLEGSNITKLPNDLYTTNYLNLDNCKQLIKLPDKLHVEGKLNLSDCNQLTELPDNLYVKESLVLYGTNITELPNNLYVGWNLFIYNTPLVKKYTNEEIREIVTSTGGQIIGDIFRV